MTGNEDDRAARSQVTLRLDRDLLDRIDTLAEETGVDRTELVRRLLADGLAKRRGETALVDYATGRRSAWSAAQTAGVDLYEMLDRIAEAGIPYRVDPDALDRLRRGTGGPPSGSRSTPAPRGHGTSSSEASIAGLRTRYRPSITRLLFVGESSPAGGTHFYQADSNLYRATREALGAAFAIPDPPEGEAFLGWFRDLGCWLVDTADRPVNRASAGTRIRAVDAGIPALARSIQETEPERIVVVLRRIAPAVRRAAGVARFDDRAIDVLPFPTRQWRPVYVNQLAGIVAGVLGPGSDAASAGSRSRRPAAITEDPARYGAPLLHDVIAAVLRSHDNRWMTPSEIARDIAAGNMWRRPSDDRHPRSSQISARARSGAYADLFQTSDRGIRLRVG